MADRTVTGTLEINSRGVEVLSQIDAKMGTITNTGRVTAMATAFSAVSIAVQGVAVATDFAKRGFESLLRAGMEAERTRATWSALLGNDQTLVENRIKELETFAAKAPFTFKNIQQAAIELQATGNMSLAALKAAGDAAAIFNQDITDSVHAMLSGLRGEIEPLKRYGISTLDIQAELGHKMVETNKRTADDIDEIWAAVIRLMEKRGVDGMHTIMGTVSGQLTNLADAWDRAKKRMGGELMGGAKTGLEAGLNTLNTMLDSGIFERAGKALAGPLEAAMNMVAEQAEHGLLVTEIMQKSGKGGVGEFVFSPELSRIAERRKGVSIVGQALRSQGLPADRGLLGYELPEKYDVIADRCAIMLLSGTPESQVRAYASSAILQMAFSSVKEGPSFALPPSAGATPSVPGGGMGGTEEAGKQLWWQGTKYAGWFEAAGMTPAALEKAKQDAELWEVMGKLGMTGGKFGAGARGGSEMPADQVDPAYMAQQERLREMGLETYAILGDAGSEYGARQAEIWERIAGQGTSAYEAIQAASQQSAAVAIAWGELVAMKETRRHLTVKSFAEYAIKSVLAATLKAIAEQEAVLAAAAAARAFDGLAAGLMGILSGWGAAEASGTAALKHAAVAAMAGGAAAVIGGQASRALATITQPANDLYGENGDLSSSERSRGSTRLVASATAPANYTFSIKIEHNGATVYGKGGAEQFWHDELLPLAQEAAASGQLSVDPMRRN